MPPAPILPFPLPMPTHSQSGEQTPEWLLVSAVIIGIIAIIVCGYITIDMFRMWREDE